MSATPVFAANWKMHHGPAATRDFFRDFLDASADSLDDQLFFFVPTVSLAAARRALAGRPRIRLGVQNVFWEPAGAYTGEISVPMASAAGAVAALVGHSERRHVFGETVEETVKKCRAVLECGLQVVLCVGETLQQRRADQAEATVTAQLLPVLEAVGGRAAGRWMIAYEPVWAIGTGETATPEDAQQMHEHVYGLLDEPLKRTPILYGGSVKPGNVASLLECRRIDGVLVGGASLDPASFATLCAAGA